MVFIRYQEIKYIPGFRTGIRWKKEVAICVYIIIAIFMSASFFSVWDSSNNIGKAFMTLGCLFILLVPLYLLITDFFTNVEKNSTIEIKEHKFENYWSYPLSSIVSMGVFFGD